MKNYRKMKPMEISPTGSQLPVHIGESSSMGRQYLFKAYVIVSMTIIWTGYTISIRYTRAFWTGPMYFSSTVVVLAELVKFSLAALLLLRTHHWRFAGAKAEFTKDFLGKPKDLLKMAVPSLVYAVQNNLDFVALQNLDPGVYQVTTQLKVVTTALFMVCMLGRRFSPTRWVAIFLLFAGVALVQLDASRTNLVKVAADGDKSVVETVTQAVMTVTKEQNYFLGIAAVLTTCVTAGFAGVYFEKMLKDSETSLWIRNLQMYASGFVIALTGCLLTEGQGIWEKGFFFGYHSLVIMIVCFLGVGGIYISMVIKYLDNLLKSFAAAVSISLVSLFSFYVFSTTLGLYFVVGTAIVIGAILLYNYAAE